MPITDLLGKSILSKELNSFMVEFKLPTSPKLNLDNFGDAYDTQSRNEKKGIFLNFDGYERYKPEFGEPQLRFSKSKDELFLTEITIDNNFLKTKQASPVELPFGLQFGDSSDTVLKKLSKKQYERSETSYGYCWWTRFDEFRILTAISPASKLIWIRVIKLTNDEKQKLQLQKLLSAQNKNIDPANAKEVATFGKQLPTSLWKQRKNEGDMLFTEKSIADIENLLKEYCRNLVDLTKQKKAAAIYNSVKKVTRSINKINNKYNGFIETLEREELCEFINKIVRVTGLQIDEKIDLTEEWREW